MHEQATVAGFFQRALITREWLDTACLLTLDEPTIRRTPHQDDSAVTGQSVAQRHYLSHILRNVQGW